MTIQESSQDIKSDGNTVNLVPEWYLPRAKYKKRYQNRFTPLFSGEEVFKEIATAIQNAKESVEILSWGFDPGMPILDRNGTWQEKNTYGAILRDAARKGIKVKVLIWSSIGSNAIQKNEVGKPMIININRGGVSRGSQGNIYAEKWHQTLSQYPNLIYYTRDIKDHDIIDEDDRVVFNESTALSYPTDHQKTVMIDYEGEHPIGFMMGHNSLTAYWDTKDLLHTNKQREGANGPFHDLSMKIEGDSLEDINHNFCYSWYITLIQAKAEAEKVIRDSEIRIAQEKRNDYPNKEQTIVTYEQWIKDAKASIVELDARIANPDDGGIYERRKNIEPKIPNPNTAKSRGQIVRTRPDEQQEKQIKDTYFLATQNARNYMLITNQYFQYPRWARHLTSVAAKAKAGGLPKDLYAFIVTCKPERDGMMFRAHEIANELGVSDQFGTADKEIYDAKQNYELTEKGKEWEANAKKTQAELVQMGVNVVFCMLQSNQANQAAKDVYVHAKFMAVDDAFFTIGSANLNMRSMAVDSEINISSDDIETAYLWRTELFDMYTGGEVQQHEKNKKADVFFRKFGVHAKDNQNLAKKKQVLIGHVVPFSDSRSAGATREA